MKIALITDTHWGVRNDNAAFLDNSKQFLDNIFFPYLDGNDIKTIIHLGDLVDRRKYININTARRLREDFLEPLYNKNIEMHIIAGNHDTYFKNTNKVNALDEIVGNRYNNVTLYTGAETVLFDEVPILFVPWITDENRENTLYNINSTEAQIVMGHLEIQGFEMYRGSIVSHGDDRHIFDRFDIVMSGHYHHRNSDGHIFYLGSHAEFTWSDFDDPRGFHVFDTETRELTFIRNTYSMFEKVWYNDESEEFLNQEIDYSNFKNKIIKVIVTAKSNPYWFDKFIDNIESQNPIELQIVEDHLNLNLEDDSEIVNEAESTIDIFKKYINTFDSKTVDRIKLEKKIVELYNEALSVE